MTRSDTEPNRDQTGLIRVLGTRPQFRALFLGITASRLGDTFLGVALAWLTLTIGSPSDLGLLILVGGLPRVISAPLAGHLLDRNGLRVVLATENLLRGCLLLVIPVLSVVGQLRIGYLYPLVVVTGLLGSATEVGQEIAVPALVQDRELEAANALLAATFDLAEWVGPAAAGVMVSFVGIQPAIGVDAASFLIMAGCATALPRRVEQPKQEGQAFDLATFARGFRGLWSYRIAFLLTTTTVVFLSIDGALQVFWPVYSRTMLSAGAATYGLLISAAGVGSLAGTLALTPVLARMSPRLSLPLCVSASGGCILALTLVHAMPVAIGVAVGVGVFAAPFYPISRAIMQRIVPERERGRVFGARVAITTCGFPFGAALGGIILTDLKPATTAILIAAVHVPIALALVAIHKECGSTAN